MEAWSKSGGGNEAAVAAACYEAAIDPSLWPAALDAAMSVCGADSAILVAGDHDRRDGAAIATGVDPDIVAAYTKHAWSSPLVAPLFGAPLCTPITDRMVMPRTQFEKSAFYQNWVRPAGLGEGLVSALSPIGPDVIVLTLARDRGRSTRPFTEGKALPRFAALLPHFRRAASIQRRLIRAQALPHGVSAAALQSLTVPVLLLDVHNRVLWGNGAAETLLRTCDGLSTARDRGLVGASPADTAELGRLLADVGVGNGGAAALRRRSGLPPLVALALPCGTASDLWRSAIAPDAVPRTVLFVIDPKAPLAGRGDTASAARLRSLFGLTAAEAAMALEAAGGEGLPAVARMLGVAPGTVRSHAKAVYAKMEIRGQADLARLLARLGLIEA